MRKIAPSRRGLIPQRRVDILARLEEVGVKPTFRLPAAGAKCRAAGSGSRGALRYFI
jgi:hypothetical protein